jgi:hypothetical protein
MKAIAKPPRDRLPWLDTLAVRRFSARLRPKWTALKVFTGSLHRYDKRNAMSNLSVVHSDQGADAALANPRRKGPPRATDIVERITMSPNSHEIIDLDAIGDALQALAERGEPVTVYPAGADQAVLVRILSVHPEEPHFTLELNEGDALPPGRCTFVSWLDSARFQFELTSDFTPLPGRPWHVPADFPSHCIVLNRRSAARRETPLAGNYSASFVMFGNPYELPLFDVGAGGIGMRCAPRDAAGLHIGRKLQRVRLELGDIVVIADLEIRLSRRFRSFLLGEQVQIGCRFLNLSPQMHAEVERALGRMATSRR